jgi:hypothetical protein
MIDASLERRLAPRSLMDETPARDVRGVSRAGDELLGVGERRHAVGAADERRQLEIGDACSSSACRCGAWHRSRSGLVLAGRRAA